ncbi:glycosyltransferase family 4 protein [Enterobacter sp. JUb54]|uniref:glycosyltransferase family 4 protein n=1 Tax=Enterobacteriaceae TaxID=543 RepID=UPI00164D1D0A|nr:glycosyltransferase family 1 protein [Enterobacter sp. JUb54]QNK08291.1 glycosyltransferase family 4 protein [Enterobacter sp. JUb54]
MSSKNIYIDPRWKNAGGIGTFYEKINEINNYKKIGFKGSPASPVDTIRTSKKMLFNKDAVVFFPGYIPPLYSNMPYVFTIHDLNHLDREDNSSCAKKIFYNTIIKKGCKDASYIFTVSNFSKQRIIEWAGVSSDKVINVGNGVSDAYRPDGDFINFGFEYLLCVSNRKTHKNEIGVLNAFKIADIDKKVKLVFTGKPNETIKVQIDKLELRDRVVFTGYLDTSELPKLYRSACALVFPSFYEGFGLPVIEAQASGIPVITSASTSLGEVSGDAAILVDPCQISEIALGIERVLNSKNECYEMIQKGLLNAKNYTWEKTAKIVDTYLTSIK